MGGRGGLPRPSLSDVRRTLRISTQEPTFGESPVPVSASKQEVAQLVEALQSPELEVRYAAAEILMALDVELDRCTGVLVEALHGEAEGDSQLAANALVRLGDQAVAPLADGLQDPKVSVRQASAQALGELGEAAASVAGDLATLLTDANAGVRATAARALARIGPAARAGAGAALATAVEDSNPLVRMRAASALISLDHERGRAVGPFLEGLADENSLVRRSAAECLAVVGPEGRKAIPALTDALSDEDPHVRLACVEALGNQGAHARSAFALISEMSDSEGEPEEVRRACEAALERMV